MGSSALPVLAMGDRRLWAEQHAGVVVSALLMIALFAASPIAIMVNNDASAGRYNVTVDGVRLDRGLAGDGVEQHRVPPLSTVTMISRQM